MAKRSTKITVEVPHHVWKPPSDAECALALITVMNRADSWERERALKLAAFYFGFAVTKVQG